MYCPSIESLSMESARIVISKKSIRNQYRLCVLLLFLSGHSPWIFVYTWNATSANE